MLTWVVALAAGASLAFFSYWGGGAPPHRRPGWLQVALRGVATTLLVAAIFNAPLGFSRAARPIVLIDVSTSWLRAGDTASWNRAISEARAMRADSVILFGAAARADAIPDHPADHSSRLQPALLRALGSGRSITLITDGEIDDPRSILDALPGGSRIIVPERQVAVDAAVVSVDAPRYVTTGDSLSIRVVLVAGTGGSPGGQVSILGEDRVIATAAVGPIPPLGEEVIVVQGFWGGAVNGPVLMRTVLTAERDLEPRNDTLTSIVDASTTPAVVFVSSSPDLDARYALSVLRGTLALPARAFLRVAPGQWRLDGPLTAVGESEVRRAVTEAPVVILHGDTALFGAPRSVTRGSLALFSTATDGGDWYPTGTPPSPVSGALSGVPWDSLPPIEVSAGVGGGSWQVIETRRARQQERRMVVAGRDSPRRTVVIGASGLWRWAFKGGVSADAFAAFWGSIFDWLVAERSDERVASPAATYFREGEPIRWRRGARADSAAMVVLTARRPGARPDSVRLDFSRTSPTAESPALSAGIYEVSSEGGSSLLAVNESRELIPRRPLVTAGEVSGAPPPGDRLRVRQAPVLYVLVVALLCVEWLIRRKLGMR